MFHFKSTELVSKVINANKMTRHIALKAFDSYIYKEIVNPKIKTKLPQKVLKYKYHVISAILASVVRNMDKGFISKQVGNRMIETLGDNVFYKASNIPDSEFKRKYGENAPTFLTLSPFAGCNLACKDCYASSGVMNKTFLPYETLRKIVKEVHDVWDASFVVISGGEPMMYNDHGKTILDLFEEFPDMFFLMYTNGTLINEEVAKRMAKLGNITPAISVEGFEVETDKRRGKGIYKILTSKFELLKKHGIPFGVSVTATRKNAPLLTGEGFYDYYFKELGVTYMWVFQYMPIGRGVNTSLMVTPKQRLALFRRWEKELTEKKYFVADFWNSGMVSDGCIAYGKGYVYIDWTGNIMPCVFVPYHVDNIKKLYAKGKSLSDALFSDFFKNGRKWQDKYAKNGCEDRTGNWLRPCSIRDHYEVFRKEISDKRMKPNDPSAKEAHKSAQYFKSMVKYDKDYEKLTKKVWKEEFLGEEAKP